MATTGDRYVLSSIDGNFHCFNNLHVYSSLKDEYLWNGLTLALKCKRRNMHSNVIELRWSCCWLRNTDLFNTKIIRRMVKIQSIQLTVYRFIQGINNWISHSIFCCPSSFSFSCFFWLQMNACRYGTFASGGCDGIVNIWDGANKKRLSQVYFSIFFTLQSDEAITL